LQSIRLKRIDDRVSSTPESTKAPQKTENMAIETRLRVRTAFLSPLLLIAACGGGGGGSGSSSPVPPPPQSNSPPPPAPTYKIGGSVSGLMGSGLTLALNGSGNLSVSSNGQFTFPTGLAGNASYTVTVAAQPSGPSQLCTVASGTGSVAAADVTTVSVSCEFVGRFAYVSGTAGITAYSINHSTGLLTPLPGSPYAASGHSTNSVALHPNGKLVYAADPGGPGIAGAIAVYSIDDTTGVPTAIAGSPFTVAANPFMLAFHPSGKFVFGPNWMPPNDGVSVFSIDPGTGAPTQIAGSPFPCTPPGIPGNNNAGAISVAVSPSGSLLYVGTQVGGTLPGGLICGYSIDASTGALTALPGSPFSTAQNLTFITSLTFDPSGKFLYAAGPGSFGAFTVDAASGALTPIAGTPDLSSGNLETATVAPSGKFLYVSDDAYAPDSQIFVLSISPTTGLLTPVAGSPFSSVEFPYSVTIDPSGDLAYVALGSSAELSVYFVDKATGALTSAGNPISNGANTDPRAIAILQ
jgi:6-phosphogluconolactonase (cycloisomerase 2 family)